MQKIHVRIAADQMAAIAEDAATAGAESVAAYVREALGVGPLSPSRKTKRGSGPRSASGQSVLVIRMTDAQLDEVDHRAAEAGVTRSHYIRAAVGIQFLRGGRREYRATTAMSGGQPG